MPLHRAVIESTDGAGKSTAAEQAAIALSLDYPDHKISIADSTGVYRYQGGELAAHNWSRLEGLEPHQAVSKLAVAAKLGTFTMARRAAEAAAMRSSDVVIGVRDPYRIEPAAYSTVFGPERFSRLSPEARLRIFNTFTVAPHPKVIVHLRADPETALLTAGANGELDSHESPEKMRIIANELPLVIGGYQRLYKTRLAEVEALRPRTADEVAAQIEPLLERRGTMVFIPETPPALQ